MSSLDAVRYFAYYVDSIPNSEAIIKELKQKERNLFLKIIENSINYECHETTKLAIHILSLQDSFETQREESCWKSFCRMLSNLFQGRVSSSNIFNTIRTNPIDLPETAPTLANLLLNKLYPPIKYSKGEKILPVNKDKPLGRGAVGMMGGFGKVVYVHGEDPSLAVKQVSHKEYEMGANLDHPVLAKSYNLYSQEYEDGRPSKNRMVMERINGTSMAELKNDRISREIAVKLLEQAKACCIYLYNEGVFWADVNPGNIFIESITNNLRIIDFGYWDKKDSSFERCQLLLLGAIELAGWIVRHSDVVKNDQGQLDNVMANQILFPQDFFEGEQLSLHILTTPQFSWMNMEHLDFLKKVLELPEEELRNHLEEYFDHVIAKLQQ